MSFKDYMKDLSEAKPGRAWNGRLKNIDNLLSWMYSKDILNKGEQKKKDSLFRQYYRFYNDGDLPRGFGEYKNAYSKNGRYPDYVTDKVSLQIETDIEAFIKKILSKYMGKIDRKDFQYDQQIDNLNTVLSVTQRSDVHGLVNHWIKNVKDTETLAIIDVIKDNYKEVKGELDELIAGETENWDTQGVPSFSRPSNTRTFVSNIEELKKLDISIPKSITSKWKDIRKDLIDVEELISNLIIAVKKAKKLRAIG